MKRAAVVALAGCAAPAAPAPLGHRDARRVVVRMALAGEALTPQAEDCHADAPAPELFEPIATFAREHLVPAAQRGWVVYTHLIGTRMTTFSRPSVEIDVEPGATFGRVDVSASTASGGGKTLQFCLYVTREHGETTVVIQPSNLIDI